eukprot:TRINITY_DN2507_c0_g1_i2.p1 TRINITY_DN2507_c0_g1~~TRINITY_DN2507_c0_g1_i2.p1  ORF type:complete len:277 (-),score=65.11 TRINITY_DN2507_c0_g1_i2:115-945(-)
MNKKDIDKFKKKVKNSAELCRLSKDNITIIENDESPEKNYKKAVEQLSYCITLMKYTLFGETGQGPTNQPSVGELIENLIKHGLIMDMVVCFVDLTFESKKDWVQIFGHIVKYEKGGNQPVVTHIANSEILDSLMEALEDADIALSCGSMLRDCVAFLPVATKLLNSEKFYDFFQLVQSPDFGVASDTFSTFRDCLTIHKKLVAEFLESNYDKFMENYTLILNSENYVTQRQALKLMGELLLDRTNFNIMTKYITNKSNLKLMMRLLRSKRRNIHA